MKKKILINAMFIALLLGGTTGCGSKDSVENTPSDNTSTNNQVETKGNCNVFECIDKIQKNATLDEVNEIIGFEGVADSSGNGWEKYKWELDENSSVVVTFYIESKTSETEIKFDEKTKRNSEIDFSNYEEVSKALKAGETLTYEDFKNYFGGDGILIVKGSSSVKYKWINKDGGTLTASFNSSSGKCTIMYGVF